MPSRRPPTEVISLLREYLGKVKDDRARTAFMSAVIYCFSGSPELETLGQNIFGILRQANQDDDEPNYLGVISDVVEQSDRWLNARDQCCAVRSLAELRDVLHAAILTPIDTVFGHECRIRLYAADLRQRKYTGLVALRMSKDFIDKFESGFEIDVFEPPYQVVADTSCYALTRSRIDDLPPGTDPEQQRWYLDKLGLGTVPATFTWHFSEAGPVTYEHVKAAIAAHRTEWWWALSFDLGSQNSGATPAVPLLRIAESVLTLMAPALSAAIKRVLQEADSSIIEHSGTGTPPLPLLTGNEQVQTNADTARGPVTRQRQTHDPTQERQIEGAHSRSLKEGEQRIAVSVVGDDNRGIASWFTQSDCIPSREPWFFAATDGAALDVAQSWEELRIPRTPPGSVLLCAPPGCGKEIIARSFAGPLARGGTFFPVMIHTDEKDLEIELFGVTKGRYSAVEDGTSKVQLAGNGAVFLDEFPGWILSNPGSEAKLRSHVENLAKGRPVFRVGAAEQKKGRPWTNGALLVFAGPPDETDRFLEEYPHWPERFRRTIRIPSWADLSPASRACILRWFLIKSLAASEVNQAFVHHNAFERLVVQPDERFRKGNMRAVETVVDRAASLSAARNFHGIALYPDDLSVGGAGARVQREEVVLGDADWLALGVGSPFDGDVWLGSQCDLVRAVAECPEADHGSGHGCVTTKLKIAIGYNEDEGSVDITHDQLLDLHYLLLAAVRNSARSKSVTPEKSEADPFLTSVSRVTHHFNSRVPYNEAFKKHFGEQGTPASFRITSAEGGKQQYPNGPIFRDYVRQNARRLQGLVERVACAYPPYIHLVPFWDWEQLSTPERIQIATNGERDELEHTT